MRPGPFLRTEAALDRLLGGRFVLQVLVLYGLTRILTGVLLALVAPSQAPAGMTGGHPVGYFGFARLWDGEWYDRIANEGYPATLPRTPGGQVLQNSWAFYPLFPFLARVGMTLTGQSFTVIGPLLALVLGFGAAVLMALLMREVIGRVGALLVLAVYAVFPSSPALQVAYTESLAMLLLCGYLLALRRERWLVATGLALLVGVSRPIAAPLAVVTVVALIVRWRRRRDDPISRGEGLRALAALVGCGVAGLLWPAIAWLATGEPGAYVSTMGAWSVGGRVRFLQPWLDTPRWYLGESGPWLLAAILIALFASMLGPWATRLGSVLRTWPLVYAAYLIAVQGPGTSTPRYLLPMFPVLAPLLGLASRSQWPKLPTGIRLIWLLPLALWFQWKWITVLWHFTPPTDWAP